MKTLIHFLQLFFIFYKFSSLPKTTGLNFCVDVEMSKLFLKIPISKKE